MRLDRSKFKSWLEAKQPDEIVGENRDCCGCPIANFHYQASGWEVSIFDNGDGYMIDRGHSRRPLPEWAACFAFLVDGDIDYKISATRALEILAQLS